VDKPNLLDEGPAAEYISMSVAFLQAGRCQGTTGNRTPTPAFHKLGRLVKYDVADLDAWLLARRIDPMRERTPIATGAARFVSRAKVAPVARDKQRPKSTKATKSATARP
jgi:hypothetical protein